LESVTEIGEIEKPFEVSFQVPNEKIKLLSEVSESRVSIMHGTNPSVW
jgi:hypothetical protein